MLIQTSQLIGPALDWAVGKADGYDLRPSLNPSISIIGPYSPAYNWSQGGPIIERERINITPYNQGWMACQYEYGNELSIAEGFGPTPLIAAMRCYVASKLGDIVDIPEELCN